MNRSTSYLKKTFFFTIKFLSCIAISAFVTIVLSAAVLMNLNLPRITTIILLFGIIIGSFTLAYKILSSAAKNFTDTIDTTHTTFPWQDWDEIMSHKKSMIDARSPNYKTPSHDYFEKYNECNDYYDRYHIK